MKGSLPPNWLLLIRKTVGVAEAGEKSVLWINDHVKELKRKQTAFHSQLLLAYTVS